MHSILVTGANGQLGSEIRELSSNYPQYHFMFTDAGELDICDFSGVDEFITENKINAIINCAAYTSVDKAEENSSVANAINHLATENLAKVAKTNNIKLIHISTDYVFDGNTCQPYVETDAPNPQSVYGKTKLDGEKAMQVINPANSIIIRTSWVYSSYGNNFVKTMMRLGKGMDELGVVYDQIGSPTNARDLAKVILDIFPNIKNEDIEIFHYANEGVCSWYDFAVAIFEIVELRVKVKPLQSSQYPLPAKRPFYSALNKSRIKEKYNVQIPYWRESLVSCLEN